MSLMSGFQKLCLLLIQVYADLKVTPEEVAALQHLCVLSGVEVVIVRPGDVLRLTTDGMPAHCTKDSWQQIVGEAPTTVVQFLRPFGTKVVEVVAEAGHAFLQDTSRPGAAPVKRLFITVERDSEAGELEYILTEHMGLNVGVFSSVAVA